MGAVLARDKSAAVLQEDHLNLIAGKHRSHRNHGGHDHAETD